MTKKEQRLFIYNKFGGRCAYCGEELNGKFHVDEIEPCRRKQKWVRPMWTNGPPESEDSETQLVPGRWVDDGYEHPDRLNVDNQYPACPSCNINKHSGSVEDFRALITGFKKHLNEVSTQYKIYKRYGMVQEVDKPVVFYFETYNKQL